MKKTLFIVSLFLTTIMQAQDRPQPKPGPAPVINIGKPQTFELKNGLKVMVVENNKLPRVSFNLSIDNAPYAEGSKKGVANLASVMMGNGTTSMPKDKFNEEVDFLGANIGFSLGGASASGLSKYTDKILALMVDGALNSVFTQEELEKETAKLLEGIKSEEKSVEAVAGRVEDVLFYGRTHPNGEYLTEETIKNVSLADVKMQYTTYFVPENAYLVVIGDVKFKDIKKAVTKAFSGWKKATAPTVTYANPKDVQYSQINFVDMPNAVQSEISLVNVSDLKMTDVDYFPVLLANQVLGGDFNSYLNMNLREANGWTYGARSSIRGNKYVGKFKANTQVRNAVTDSAVVEFFKEIKKIRTEKVEDDMLKNVKAGYVGNFVMAMEKPGTIARYALLAQTQKLPDDFFENYVKNINAVTAEDILRVSQKYFRDENMRVLITGKASEVLGPLESLKMPLFYFDKFGNPTEKPATSKEIPAGVTLKTVYDNYIKAIGGEKAVKSVKSVMMVGSTTIPQAPQPLTYTQKADNKNRLSVDVSMGAMNMMKQVTSDKVAYMSQQGQKMDVPAADLAEAKEGAVFFPELSDTAGKLAVIESIEGSDAYAIENGKVTKYYDVKSGLKVAETTTQDVGGQKSVATTYFKDYKEVKGVQFPYTIIMNVGIELDIKMSEVKVNEGVTDADFK
jgi:predicted Zn-dependent peptidase